jgi:hypothetical protein
VTAGHSGGLEAPRSWKVAQLGLVGQAVCEVVKVDRGEEVVRLGGLDGLLRGLGLLGEAEAWIRRDRARRGLIRRRGEEGAALEGRRTGPASNPAHSHVSRRPARASLLAALCGTAANLPGLGEVVRALPRAQRHLGSPSQRRVVHDRRGARSRHGVGGARLAQPAAVLGRLLEFAHAVLCAWYISMGSSLRWLVT